MQQSLNHKPMFDLYNSFFTDMKKAYIKDIDFIVKKRAELYTKYESIGYENGFSIKQCYDNETYSIIRDCTNAYKNNIIDISNDYTNYILSINTYHPLVKAPLINNVQQKADNFVRASADIKQHGISEYNTIINEIYKTKFSNGMFETTCSLVDSGCLFDISFNTYVFLLLSFVKLLVMFLKYKKYVNDNT